MKVCFLCLLTIAVQAAPAPFPRQGRLSMEGEWTIFFNDSHGTPVVFGADGTCLAFGNGKNFRPSLYGRWYIRDNVLIIGGYRHEGEKPERYWEIPMVNHNFFQGINEYEVKITLKRNR